MQNSDKSIRIGYQGMQGSNSEAAAIGFTKKLGLEHVQLIPLINSISVTQALKTHSIRYGVVAVRNSIGGTVEETRTALKTVDISIVSSISLPIHHCLFVKDHNVRKEDITAVCSHPQALKQCSQNIRLQLNEVNLVELEDTAIGAKYLAEGRLGEMVGVLCSRRAGEMHHLHLLYENFEDRSDNVTDFDMIELR